MFVKPRLDEVIRLCDANDYVHADIQINEIYEYFTMHHEAFTEDDVDCMFWLLKRISRHIYDHRRV